MLDPISASAKRTAQRHLDSAADALKLMDAKERRQLSLVAGIRSLQAGQCIDGYNLEHLQERARLLGIDFDPSHPVWPYSILSTRATPLAVGQGGSAGGYLVGAENEALEDTFRPYSPFLKSGVTVLDNLGAHALIPRVTQDVGGQWLTSETASITEAPPLLGSIAMTPKNFGITLRITRQLMQQAPDVETSARRICAKAAIQGVDTAALTGVGGVGLPLGLLNQQGIGTQSGTSYSHASSLTTRATLANANVDDSSIAWLGATGVRTILAARERNAGNEYVWTSTDQISGRRADVSTIVPAGTLIAGDWSQLVYAFFGPGFQIDATPYTSAADFQVGNITLRLMVSVDIALLHPAAFVSITGIT